MIKLTITRELLLVVVLPLTAVYAVHIVFKLVKYGDEPGGVNDQVKIVLREIEKETK